jgi:8-oxo-dGTP diphosphatase
MANLHVVVAAILRRDHRLLLVEEMGPGDPEPAWMLPGGVVEEGESAIDALERELREETGLRLDAPPMLAFATHVFQADASHLALTFACEAAGSLAPADPDGYILSAEWVDQDDALDRLGRVPWYDAGPLRRWLDEPRTVEVSVMDRR